MHKIKVIVSACLLGELCRYDGKEKGHLALQLWLKDKHVILFCPEAPVLGTPRPPIHVEKDDADFYLLENESHRDVTRLVRDEIEAFYNGLTI
jgi:uncharacterized protein YbbK (DUF523 family)